MDDSTRTEIADSLERLAAQDVWDTDVWQRCYHLVGEHIKEDPLLGYVFDDLIHYSGRRLFRSVPIAADFNEYRQEFRNSAAALRSHMSIAEYRTRYE